MILIDKQRNTRYEIGHGVTMENRISWSFLPRDVPRQRGAGHFPGRQGQGVVYGASRKNVLSFSDRDARLCSHGHYYLLIRPREKNLSRGMQWLGTSYTRRFNLSNERIGHLFQGRSKNIVVENDDYLLRLSCYIHRNPLRAGIVGRLADYRWSSYVATGTGRSLPNG